MTSLVRTGRLVCWVSCLISVLAIPARSAAQDSRLFITAIGRDHDSVSSPLSGVTVRVTRTEDGALVKTATTDGLGLAEIVVPPLQKCCYLIVGTLEGYVPLMGAPGFELFPPPGDVAVGIHLQMIPVDPGPDIGAPTTGPALGGIFGRIVLVDGTPVPFTLLNARGPRLQPSTQTAEDGSFRIETFPDLYTIESPGSRFALRPGALRGAKSGVFPSPVRIVAGRYTGPVDLVLEPLDLFHIAVTVTNELGDSVSGAQIEFTGLERSGLESTGEDGTTTIGPFAPNSKQTIFVNTRLDGVELAGVASVDVLDSDQEVSIVLRPAATLSGRVEFIDRSRPLQGGHGPRVVARGPDSTSSGASRARSVLVDPEGGFTLTGLVGDLCLSVVDAPAPWVVRDVALQGLDVTNQLLTFKPGEQISGLLFRLEQGDGSHWTYPKCKP